MIVHRKFRRMPHRCVKCMARRTLPKLWTQYERPPKCRVCGYKRLYPCPDRLSRKDKRNIKCNCGAYEFIHRKGSKYCHHNPNAEQHWSERYEEATGAYLPVNL